MFDNNTKKYKVYNSDAINAISKKRNTSKQLIYYALNGERKSEKSKLMIQDYHLLINKLQPIVKNYKKEVEVIIEEFLTAENADS